MRDRFFSALILSLVFALSYSYTGDNLSWLYEMPKGNGWRDPSPAFPVVGRIILVCLVIGGFLTNPVGALSRRMRQEYLYY